MNGFEAYADQAIPQPVKRKLDRQAERVIEVHKEREQLSKTYRRQRAEWEESVFEANPRMRAMAAWVDGLSLEDADELIEQIEMADWLRRGTSDERYLALSRIDKHIMKLREKAGMTTFDDPWPDEQPNAFIIIRSLLQ